MKTTEQLTSTNLELRQALVSCQSNMRLLAKAAGQYCAGSCFAKADEAAEQAMLKSDALMKSLPSWDEVEDARDSRTPIFVNRLVKEREMLKDALQSIVQASEKYDGVVPSLHLDNAKAALRQLMITTTIRCPAAGLM